MKAFNREFATASRDVDAKFDLTASDMPGSNDRDPT